MPWEILNSCSATDDLGTEYRLHFSGGGADDNWAGQLLVAPTPPANVRWLDFSLPGAAPVRLRLDAAPRDLPTTERPLPAGETADRYLDAQTVALLTADDDEDGKDPCVVWAARGLLEAGVLAPLNPALRRLAAVASRLGLELPAPLAVIPPGPLPAEWLSLLDRWGCHDGPTGTVPVAAYPWSLAAYDVPSPIFSPPRGRGGPVARTWLAPARFPPTVARPVPLVGP